MDFSQFGVDTISYGGNLAAKLEAAKAVGFRQIMIGHKDFASYNGPYHEALALIKNSGLAVTGFQFLRDYEGLSEPMRSYKHDIAKQMLRMAVDLNAPMLLVCSSSSPHGSKDFDTIVSDLQRLSMLALPHNIKVGYEALSWGHTINEYAQSWEVVQAANRANLGVVLDSFHMIANQSNPEGLRDIPAHKICLVQLADFMWAHVATNADKIETARHMRVFPGEGAHSAQLADILRAIDDTGYRGNYSFEVFNDDYQGLPQAFVSAKAVQSVKWVSEQVLRYRLPIRTRAIERESTWAQQFSM